MAESSPLLLQASELPPCRHVTPLHRINLIHRVVFNELARSCFASPPFRSHPAKHTSVGIVGLHVAWSQVRDLGICSALFGRVVLSWKPRQFHLAGPLASMLRDSFKWQGPCPLVIAAMGSCAVLLQPTNREPDQIYGGDCFPTCAAIVFSSATKTEGQAAKSVHNSCVPKSLV
ncbi:hypothetical protein VNO77_31196 [Canavalia gladiata]|uniref:Uncharacterized protein n=1 Tax=Canavalia gladiata TaxID=3824 RepID=A0AAN9KRH1_CANGL